MAEPLKKGEVWRCPFAECGCAVQVIESPKKPRSDELQPPRCCCGCELVKEKP